MRRHPKLILLAVIAVLLTGLWFLLDYHAKHRLNSLVAALRAAGEPLSIRDVERLRRSYPDDQNMALSLIEPGRAINDYEQSESFKSRAASTPIFGNGATPAIGERWPDESLELCRRVLDDNRSILQAVHRAARLPGGRYPVEWREPSVNTLFPHMVRHPMLMKLLRCEAMVAAHDGRRDEAYRALQDVLALNDVLSDELMLFAGLRALACHALCLNAILETVSLTPLTDAQLADLQSRIASAEDRPSLRLAYLGERAVMFESLSWAYAMDDIAEIDFYCVARSSAWRLLPGSMYLDQEALLRIESKLCDAARLPLQQAVAQATKIEQESLPVPSYCRCAQMLLPSMAKAFTIWSRKLATSRAAQAALAAERFRLVNGRWPTSLGQLQPEYLSEIPQDPFSEGPLKFAADDRGVRIWSIGSDGVDDGGKVRQLESVRRTKDDGDEGAFLPSVDRRNRPARPRPSLSG